MGVDDSFRKTLFHERSSPASLPPRGAAVSARYDYVLWSETDDAQGAWRFVLRSVDGQQRIEADDIEPQDRGERLQLLALVRGLEALDRPARIALLIGSRYLYRGLTYGLREWRTQGWMWESYGRMTPVKNADLWKRLDRAMAIHSVEVRSPAAVRYTRRSDKTARTRLHAASAARKGSWWRRLAGAAGDWLGNMAGTQSSAGFSDRSLACE